MPRNINAPTQQRWQRMTAPTTVPPIPHPPRETVVPEEARGPRPQGYERFSTGGRPPRPDGACDCNTCRWTRHEPPIASLPGPPHAPHDSPWYISLVGDTYVPSEPGTVFGLDRSGDPQRLAGQRLTPESQLQTLRELYGQDTIGAIAFANSPRANELRYMQERANRDLDRAIAASGPPLRPLGFRTDSVGRVVTDPNCGCRRCKRSRAKDSGEE